MLGFIKKCFFVFLTSIVNTSNRTKGVSLSNQKCQIQPTLIHLHPNDYSQELYYYPFTIKLDKCVGSCNTLNELSIKVCVPNKTEDLNIYVFNMNTGKMSQKFQQKIHHVNVNVILMKENVIQINGGITINVDASVKNIYVKKIIFGILLHVVTKMENI